MLLFQLNKFGKQVYSSKLFPGSVYTRFTSNQTTTQTETKKETPKIRITTIPKHLDELPITERREVIVKNEPIFPPMIKQESLNLSVPFDEVPGPKLLKHVAKIWSIIPTIGTQVTSSTIQYMLGASSLNGTNLSWGHNSRIFRWLLDEYGPVVRLQGPFGGDVVILSRSEDALTVFANEGRYPVRSSLDCIENYRLKYRRYKNAGPFLMYGQDWEKLRSQIEIPLQNSIAYQFKNLDSVNDDFISRIRQIRNRQEEVPSNFYEEIHKWALECLSSVILGQKLGFMDQRGSISTSEPFRILKAFYGATAAIKKCESGLHLWKFIETPSWKNLIKNCDIIDSVLNKYIREAENSLRNKKKDTTTTTPAVQNDIPILQSLLLQDGMFPEDILTVFLDMMLIGVNASAHSIAFLLYHLARNPRAQRILADEVRAAPETLDATKLSNLKYMQACIKESLRLKPPIPFLSRILTRDIVVHNYKIPKGTVILIATYLSSIREEHFDDATKFLPERWLNNNMHADCSFATIPFGYGPKACLAKNLAEMQLSLALVKILRAFKIEYHYGNINSTNKMLSSPDRDLKFRFIHRATR